jgi:hypothetical protein
VEEGMDDGDKDEGENHRREQLLAGWRGTRMTRIWTREGEE